MNGVDGSDYICSTRILRKMLQARLELLPTNGVMSRHDRFEPTAGPGVGATIGYVVAALGALSIAFVPVYAAGDATEAPTSVTAPLATENLPPAQ